MNAPATCEPLTKTRDHELRLEALPGVEDDAAEIAGRLLISDEVRSVTIDRRAASATVQTRHAEPTGADLAELAGLVPPTHCP